LQRAALIEASDPSMFDIGDENASSDAASMPSLKDLFPTRSTWTDTCCGDSSGFRTVARGTRYSESWLIAVGVAVFPLNTLLTCPRLEQRAVHGEVLVRHQIGRASHHTLEETVGDGVLQQSNAVSS
jgi:hypothetical protein